MKYALHAALVLATIAVSAGVLSVPAYAHAAPFTVRAGSAPAGATVAFTATSGAFAIRDTTSFQTLTCTGSTISGTVRTGVGNGVTTGTLDGSKATFKGCSGLSGIKFEITGYGTWNVNVRDATDGVSVGTVTNVRAHLRTLSGPACSWDFAANTGSFTSSGTSTTPPGSFAHSYTNSSRQLSVPASKPGSLGLWNVKGTGTNTYCIASNIFNQGDQMSLVDSWTITADNAAYNPISIT